MYIIFQDIFQNSFSNKTVQAKKKSYFKSVKIRKNISLAFPGSGDHIREKGFVIFPSRK
jgi:hypothetical protein